MSKWSSVDRYIYNVSKKRQVNVHIDMQDAEVRNVHDEEETIYSISRIEFSDRFRFSEFCDTICDSHWHDPLLHGVMA